MTKFDEEIEHARFYDTNLNWEPRIKREVPFLQKYLANKNILDIACATGRHSLALEEFGAVSLGIDISPGMVAVANEKKKEQDGKSTFFTADVSALDLPTKLKEAGLKMEFDGGIMLGNAISNFGSLMAGVRGMRNIYSLLKKNSTFICQTVNRPNSFFYFPPRFQPDKVFIRLMVPNQQVAENNMFLHAALINLKEQKYEFQRVSKTFMYSVEEFTDLVTSVGFKVVEQYSNYNGDPVDESDGATTIWVLLK